MFQQMEMQYDKNLGKIQSTHCFQTPRQLFNSPRQLLQRKQQFNNFHRKKRPTQIDIKNIFSYISPTRQVKHIPINLQINLQIDHHINTSISINKSNENTQTSINQDCEVKKIQTIEIKKSQKIEELKALVDKYRIQNQQLTIKNSDYLKKIKLITDEKDNMKKQIIKFQEIIKNKQIESKQNLQLKQILSKSLESEKKSKQHKQKMIKYLEGIVERLNEKINQIISKSDDEINKKKQYETIIKVQQQIHKLKETLKYTGIENGILKKKNLQGQSYKLELQKAKEQNKKLQVKIDQLLRIKHRFLALNDFYDPLFELTPEKE